MFMTAEKHCWKIRCTKLYFILSLKHHHSEKNDGWKSRRPIANTHLLQNSRSDCWTTVRFSGVLWRGTHYSWTTGHNPSPRGHSHHTGVHPAMFYVTCATYEYLRRLKKIFSWAVEWLDIMLNYYKRTVTGWDGGGGGGGLYSIFMHHRQRTQTQWPHLSCLLIGATAGCHKMRICHGTWRFVRRPSFIVHNALLLLADSPTLMLFKCPMEPCCTR